MKYVGKDRIHLENGRIYIPIDVAAKKLKRNIKSLIPTIQWSGPKKRCWWTYATKENVAKISRAFDVELTPVNVIDNEYSKYLIDNRSFIKTKPYEHQLEALVRCGGRRNFGYFMQQGLGKTKVAIDDASILHGMKKIDSVLVVCPKSVLSVWEREIRTHGHPDWQVTIWPDEEEEFVDELRWFVINPDILINIKGFDAAWRFISSSYRTMMVVDESTIIKNHGAKRTQAVKRLGKRCMYRRILTGTPVANSPIDLFSQLEFLDESIVGYRNYLSFRNRYCIMGGYMKRQIIGYINKPELQEMIHNNGFYKKSKDAIDLPEKVYQVREITLGAKARKAYNTMVEELKVMLDDGSVVTTTHVLTQMTKLAQVTGGVVRSDQGKEVVVGREKINEVIHILEESDGEPALIWCQYRAEMNHIKQVLQKAGFRVALYDGSMTAKARGETVSDFEDKGSLDVLVLQNQAGAMGITLNRATVSIYYSNHLSPMIREQSEFRNWRIGQEKKVVYIDLLCKGLMDHRFYRLLQKKQSLNESIVNKKGELDKDAVLSVLQKAR